MDEADLGKLGGRENEGGGEHEKERARDKDKQGCIEPGSGYQFSSCSCDLDSLTET